MLRALLIVVLLSVFFVTLAMMVNNNHAIIFDAHVLTALRVPGHPEDPIGPAWVEAAARDITAIGSNSVLILLLIGACWYLVLQQKWGTALFIAVAIAGGGATSFLLKAGFDRPRPNVVVRETEVFTSSFPSSHAMASAVTFLILGALLAQSETSTRVKIFLFSMAAVLTLIVGASRVYLGVHWPSDVIAGWTAGTVWALLAWMLARQLQRRVGYKSSDDLRARRGNRDETL